MTEQGRELADKLQRAMPQGTGGPTFASSWEAAERRAEQGRRQLHMAAAAAVAVIGLVIVIDFAEPPGEALEYIEVAELLNSTSWSAPSDTLLPSRRVDVYEEVPNLLESTNVYEGALL